jgi:ABC-type Mn2+/Zn2+ transport system ATPase subunit
MDEVFEGLDEDGENAVFDLIRMKADEGKSVYVISHSALLDSLYANTVHFGNENNTTLILN